MNEEDIGMGELGGNTDLNQDLSSKFGLSLRLQKLMSKKKKYKT